MSHVRIFLFVLLFSLRSLVIAGDYIVIDDSGDLIAVGESGGSQVMVAQQFETEEGGNFKDFTFTYGENTGTPNGDIEWSLRADDNGVPGTILRSLPNTPIPTATMTIVLHTGYGTVYLTPYTKYWIVFQAFDQAAGNNYNIVGGELSDYPPQFATSTNNGTTWITTNDTDLAMTITIADVSDAETTHIFGESDLRIDDLIAFLEEALTYINNLPDDLTSHNGTQYLPSETATQLMGYAKWLFSFNTAQETLGVSLAPIGVNLYILLSIIVVLAISWAFIKIIVLIIRFVQYIARWILDLIPGT